MARHNTIVHNAMTSTNRHKDLMDHDGFDDFEPAAKLPLTERLGRRILDLKDAVTKFFGPVFRE